MTTSAAAPRIDLPAVDTLTDEQLATAFAAFAAEIAHREAVKATPTASATRAAAVRPTPAARSAAADAAG